ncbi:MAG TPA: CGNR zinc finger domain-containing protein [Ktedonobacteraceae bacterium]|nr:CGNR zinc finger domain-containing protein [Ktedonobacteraceae bacterium]
MTITDEEQRKAAPGALALVQALVNTQYGQARRAHAELKGPDNLRTWLVARGLLAEDMPVTEGDFRRVILLREALRSLLRANNETGTLDSQVEALNHLASNTPLTVRFHHDGVPTLEPDIAGVDGALARLVGIVYTAMTDGTWERLKVCRNDRCQKAFYDTSKNRSGAWCSMAGCGSRLKARSYRHRHTANMEG